MYTTLNITEISILSFWEAAMLLTAQRREFAKKCPLFSRLSPPPNLRKSKFVLEDGSFMWKNIYSLYAFGIIP